MIELLKSPADLALANLASFKFSLKEPRSLAPFLDLHGLALLAKAASSSKLKKEKQIQLELLNILAYLLSCEHVNHASLFDPAPLARLVQKTSVSSPVEIRRVLNVLEVFIYFL